MLYSLSGISVFFLIIGIYGFLKKKPVIGWLFVALGIAGLLLWAAVIAVFPEKL